MYTSHRPSCSCAALNMHHSPSQTNHLSNVMLQLTQECDTKGLGELQAALSLCNEPTFQYDLEYINDIMGWDPTTSVPPAAASGPLPAAAPPMRQVASRCCCTISTHIATTCRDAAESLLP
jgi:hypothetical protein